MSKQDYSDKIVELLEGIVSRTNDINRDPDSERCLELDLVMEDVRLLYRYFGMMKKQFEAGHRQEAATPATPAREVPSFFTDATEPVESPDKPHETPSQANPAPVPPADPDPLPPASHNPVKPADPDPLPPVSHNPVKPADPDPLPPVRQNPVTPADPDPAPPVRQDPVKPTDPDPVPPTMPDHHPEPDIKPEPSQKKEAESLPQPPVRQAPENNTGNGKTVIDLFSETQPRSVKDKLSGEDNSVHQRIASQKEDKSIGARLQQHPIGHIKEAIGLNEKFLFINELFNGDIQAYNEAIANLNDMGDLTKAFDYLNKLTKDHGWDAGRSAETIEKLAGFVQRRYM